MNTSSVDRDRAPRRLVKPDHAYLLATGISVAGSAFGLLGATGATTAAGKGGGGAVYTGLYMAAVLVTSAVSVPYSPRVCRRLGARRAFVVLQAVSAVAWVLAGIGLLVGVSTMPVLLVAAPVFGVTGGLSNVLRPVLTKSYSPTEGTAEAFARLSVVSGIGWGVGALVGGALLSNIPLGWGLVLNGVSVVALVLTVERVTPRSEPSVPRSADRPWHDARDALAGSRVLRWTAVLGASSTIFLAPLTSLVVPIAQELRQQPLVAGAGFLMAAISVGEFLSPRVVRLLGSRRLDLQAGGLSGFGSGLVLMLLGAASVLETGRTELAAWLVIGVLFGALRYAARAFFVGSAAESGNPEETSTNLAAAMLVSGLAAPLGTLGWSALIGGVSAYAAVVIGGVGAVAVGLVVYIVSRRFSAG